MEIRLNLDTKDITKIINLAMGGCVELLDYPELSTLVDKTDGEGHLFDHKRDYDSWTAYHNWSEGLTPVHALAFKFHTEILDYPEYFKLKNKKGITPLHLLSEKLLPTDIKVMEKMLKIEGLGEMRDYQGETPLHNIAKQGFAPILDYPGISEIESPEWNCHGTPMTNLYYYAKDNLDKLLNHPHILTEYETHGSPLWNLSRNKKIRPSVKKLKQHGFKLTQKWHSSKKLDNDIIADILSVPQSLRFIIY